jgi:hypothetical protein
LELKFEFGKKEKKMENKKEKRKKKKKRALGPIPYLGPLYFSSTRPNRMWLARA